METPAYLCAGRDYLYYVRHVPPGSACGRVVLVGPFASERVYAYPSCVLWARTLADRGFEVYRFDYRGVGESTGRFEAMCFSTWLEDLELVMELAGKEDPGVPMVLHGIRAGCLLAGRCFSTGKADALLLWEPPVSARAHLEEILRRRLAEDLALGIDGDRRTRAEYIQDMQDGKRVVVEGYGWTGRLWEDASRFELSSVVAGKADIRPRKTIRLVRQRERRFVDGTGDWWIPVDYPPFWTGQNPRLSPVLDDLLEVSAAWLSSLLDPGGKGAR